VECKVTGLKQGDQLFYQISTDWDDLNTIQTFSPIEIEQDVSETEFTIDDLDASSDIMIRLR
jgi:hypothetical protein